MPGWRWGIRERKNLHEVEIITVCQGPWQADALQGPAGGVKDATSGGSQWAVHEALIQIDARSPTAGLCLRA